MNLSLTNHFVAITNLYAKGARTLIMPNAVDFTVGSGLFRLMLPPRMVFSAKWS